jgi:uncharacterized membrane protein
MRFALLFNAALVAVAFTLENVTFTVAALFFLAGAVGLALINRRLNGLAQAHQESERRLEAMEAKVERYEPQ